MVRDRRVTSKLLTDRKHGLQDVSRYPGRSIQLPKCPREFIQRFSSFYDYFYLYLWTCENSTITYTFDVMSEENFILVQFFPRRIRRGETRDRDFSSSTLNYAHVTCKYGTCGTSGRFLVKNLSSPTLGPSSFFFVKYLYYDSCIDHQVPR